MMDVFWSENIRGAMSRILADKQEEIKTVKIAPQHYSVVGKLSFMSDHVGSAYT